MRKTVVLLFIGFCFIGLTWLGCDMQPSQVTGPDTELELIAKVALPDIAINRLIAVQEKHTNKLMAIEGVVGSAVGVEDNGNGAIIVLAKRPGVPGIPHVLENIPVRVIVTGEIKALLKPDEPGKPDKTGDKKPQDPIDPTAWFTRPVPIGVSTGHPAITAGTIGARVTDGTSVFALSNNHVYADENAASIGDQVIQPGTYDGGSAPDDAIGTLYDYETIVFSESASNTIDAAIALTTTSLLGNSTPSDGYGVPKSTTTGVRVNLKVKKYGRTTGLTTGKIFAINATVLVGYYAGTARFVNQIIIIPGGFSAGGDSGSLIVSNDRKTKDQPVGLLFAGSTKVTVANPIDSVLERFGVSIDGN